MAIGRRRSRFVLALFVLWVADRAFVERDRRLVGLAAVGTAVVFLSHAEVFLILAAALVGLGIGRTLVAPARSRAGRSACGGRTVATLVAPALALGIVGGGLLLGAAGGWLLTGEARVLGYVVGRDSPAARRVRRARPARRDPGRLDLHRRSDLGLLHGVGRARPRRNAAAGLVHRFAPAAALDPADLARPRRPDAVRAGRAAARSSSRRSWPGRSSTRGDGGSCSAGRSSPSSSSPAR